MRIGQLEFANQEDYKMYFSSKPKVVIKDGHANIYLTSDQDENQHGLALCFTKLIRENKFQ
jgi:hypothetical protein